VDAISLQCFNINKLSSEVFVARLMDFPISHWRKAMHEQLNYMKLLGIACLVAASTACQPVYVQGGGGGYGGGPGMGQPTAPTSGIWHSDIRARIERAKAWIDNGEARGTLTRFETNRLRMELNAIIQQVESFQNDDNRVSHKDREQIHNSLTHLERAVYKESYDDQYRRR
jgi:hypothetical protein